MKNIEIEMITVGEDGVADLTEEQVALIRARFSEAARGPEGKNPSTWTKEEYAAHQDKIERKLRGLK